MKTTFTIPQAQKSPNYRRVESEIRRCQHRINILQARLRAAQYAPPLAELVRVTAKTNGVTVEGLTGRGQRRALRESRVVLVHLANAYGFGLGEVAELLGVRIDTVKRYAGLYTDWALDSADFRRRAQRTENQVRAYAAQLRRHRIENPTTLPAA